MRVLSLSILALACAMASPRAQTITFGEHISPIIYNNCTSCHRTGEIGAMPFTNYSEVAAHATMVKHVTQNRSMPPWKPNPNYGRHIGEQILTQREIDMIRDWVDAGFPQGDPGLEAPLPTFPTGSVLGAPDLVLTMAEPFAIRGDNEDQYQVFVLPTGLTEHRAIAAVEFRPGNRQIVHHALLAIDVTGTARRKDLATPEYGYESFGGFDSPIAAILPSYTPGSRTVAFPQGVGQILPQNADLLVQVHYAPWPIAESDQSSVNIFFKKEPLEREVGLIAIVPFSLADVKAFFGSGGRDIEQLRALGALSPTIKDLIDLFTSADDLFGAVNPMAKLEIDSRFFIPARAVKTFRGTLTIDRDISLLSIYPHMHLLGKSWDVYAVDPQGNRTDLVRISDWDFNWQGSYTFTHFQKIVAGSKIHAVTTYDNTIGNPLNPNYPPRTVAWGEKTTDEMLLVAMEYVPYRTGDEYIALSPSVGYAARIDFDGNGQRSLDDFRLFAEHFGLSRGDADFDPRFDLNRDGRVDFADFIIFARLFGE